jgi:hypothetical protein
MTDMVFNADLGPVTQDELDDWIWNMMNDDDDDQDFECRNGFLNYALTGGKIQKILPETEVNTFCNLLQKKTRFPQLWQQSDQAALTALEQKITSSKKEERAKVRDQHAFEREENTVEGQRVREKSSGKLGTAVSGCIGDLTGIGDYLIIFDGGGSSEFVARDDLEILCRQCEGASNLRCLRCKQVWYCGRECQRKDWKTHKHKCKERVAQTVEDDDNAVLVHSCALCQTEANHNCSQCKQVWYCGRHCQRHHWKEHKKDCQNSNATA